MHKISDEELAKLNERNFERDGCRWPHLTNEMLAKQLGIKRVYTGDLKPGDVGGWLIGYERIDQKD